MTALKRSWRVPFWAWLPIGLAITAEAAINALRAYGLGTQLEHFTVRVTAFGHTVTVSLAGAVLVLAAVAISISQARAAWVAFQPGALARQRFVAAPIALLLLAVSVSALALTLLEAQRGKTGEEGTQRTAYDTAKADYLRADAELSGLQGTRTPDEVKAAMGAAPVSRLVFRRTAECTDITKQDSFDACRPILDLRQEMARAIRKIELEGTVPALKATLDALPRPAEASAFELLMGSVWGWIMGLAVVLVATFGAPLFAVPHVERSKPQSDSANGSQPLFREHTALLANGPNGPNGSPNGSETNDPGGGLIAFPNVPRPSTPNGSAATPANGLEPEHAERRANVLAFIRDEAKIGQAVESQAYLGETLGIAPSTLSELLGEMEADGLIARRQEGRRKVITIPELADERTFA